MPPVKKCYVVTFEVGNEATRREVRGRLKGYGTYCPITKYCWGIVTEQTASQIRDNIKEALEPTDRVFVVRSGTEAAWNNSYGPKNNSWLKKHL